MTKADAPTAIKAAIRCNADYRWTVPKVTAFLRALATCGKVAEAAREVGMSRQAAYALKARLAHPQFQQMWALAVRKGIAARVQARQPASPWGKPGLAGLAYLAHSVPTSLQADTLPGQADAPAKQADTLRGQVDTFSAKLTF